MKRWVEYDLEVVSDSWLEVGKGALALEPASAARSFHTYNSRFVKRFHETHGSILALSYPSG